jgi:hypothetical protein
VQEEHGRPPTISGEEDTLGRRTFAATGAGQATHKPSQRGTHYRAGHQTGLALAHKMLFVKARTVGGAASTFACFLIFPLLGWELRTSGGGRGLDLSF